MNQTDPSMNYKLETSETLTTSTGNTAVLMPDIDLEKEQDTDQESTDSWSEYVQWTPTCAAGDDLDDDEAYFLEDNDDDDDDDDEYDEDYDDDDDDDDESDEDFDDEDDDEEL